MLRKFFCFPFLAGLFIFAEHNRVPPGDLLQQLVNNFFSYTKQFHQQKIYIHTDKPYYICGDEMYGKVYLVNENRSAADSIKSKKIYVELINEENTVVEKTIVNGLFSSLNFNFHLGDSLPQGNYILRAYTLWMAGFGNKQNIFSTNIYIFGKGDHLSSNLTYKDSTFSSLNIALHQTKNISFANMPVHYELIYKEKVIEKSNIVTNAQGMFNVDVSAVAKENLDDAVIKIKAGSYEKLTSLPSLNNNVDVQFLPEGGSLVSDIENNVAFKAIDNFGHGINLHGYIKNSKGDIVCSFKSTHNGMGKFQFIPEGGLSYTAQIQPENGKQFSYPIVPAENYGYQLTVIKRDKDHITIRVALGDSLYKKNTATYLIATSRNNVCFTSRGVDLYEEDVPLNNFAEGVAQLTLFNDAMQPVSERLVYVHHPKATTSITSDKNNYRQREKVTLQLKAKDMEGQPVNGSYSVAVTDDGVVKHNENDGNIKTNLLLSPYLKGYIEEPGFYFKDEESSTLESLDLVMLTHGWSRFNWRDIQSNAQINSSKNDTNLSITGSLRTKRNTPAVGYDVMLVAASDNAFAGSDKTNEKGRFSFNAIDYTDSTSFILQTKNTKGFNEDVDVLFDSIAFPLTYVDRSFIAGEPDPAAIDGINFYSRFMHDSLQDKEKIRVLKEVLVRSTKKKVNYDESRRVSQVSYIITPDIIERNGNLNLTNLLYAVPGVTIFNGHISFFGLNSMTSFSDPLIMLDGTEFRGLLSDINAHDVDFIEVLRGGEAAIYGLRGGSGVVLINSKKGKDTGVRFKQTGIQSFFAPGYHVEKEFYLPKYETEESRLVKVKDERTTIYWNGNVTTTSNGAGSVSFYTGDVPSTYTVTVEGITKNGEVIHQTFPIKRTKQ